MERAINLTWKGPADAAEVAMLVDPAGTSGRETWWTRVWPQSLGWVTARHGEELIGFVNVAWDGASHAFLLDPTVRSDYRQAGIGTGLVRAACDGARNAGCEWMHVDFEPSLDRFYLGACGFSPTHAGLIRLESGSES